MPVDLTFEPLSTAKAAVTVIIGRQHNLAGMFEGATAVGSMNAALWRTMVEKVKPGDAGKSTSTLLADGSRLVAAVLPEVCSRHCSPIRNYAISALVGPAAAEGVAEDGGAAIVCVLDDATHAAGAACAVARAFPLFSMKRSGGGGAARVSFVVAGAPALPEAAYLPCRAAAASVRLAARLVDTPPEQLTTTAFVGEARAVAARLQALGRDVTVDVIAGEALRDKGYGGLWGVGKAAAEPPALCVLSYVPAAAAKSVCLVGKGIVYDTGGLAIKSVAGMCGMKMDMGGAAALMGAFEAAVAIGTETSLHCALCLAENAVGPGAFRNDDVLTFFSGVTCEVNNTDAEGRLVLSDGVAHATTPGTLPGGRVPDLVVDMATLTGAQMVATGKHHAGIFTNDEATELAAVAAGKRTGDLCHPLPYAPEFHRAQFQSKVADFKNSVAARNDAQASCAGNFIGESLHKDYAGAWLHVDIAGPAFKDDRATGFGVALVLGLLEVDGFRA